MRISFILFVLALSVNAAFMHGGASALDIDTAQNASRSREQPFPSSQDTSTLAVSPTSGPVGTIVRITGSEFPTPIAALAFTCDEGVAPTSAGVATVDLGAPQPSFDVQWEIPAQLGARQGIGGGPTPVGQCAFMTRPPYRGIGFVVTAPGSLPSVGGGGASAGGVPRLWLAAALPLIIGAFALLRGIRTARQARS